MRLLIGVLFVQPVKVDLVVGAGVSLDFYWLEIKLNSNYYILTKGGLMAFVVEYGPCFYCYRTSLKEGCADVCVSLTSSK